MKSITRTPWFWALMTIGALAGAFISYHYFPQAFPLIHLNLTMDRPQALKKADALAAEFHLGPDHAQESVLFYTDDTVKTFVELDAGGKEALISMMDQNLYQPYAWWVRRFKQFDPHEAVIRFTPDGTPYGFSEQIAENSPGAALASDQAKTIAEHVITANPWNINLADYTLVESSQEIRPSKRIDHHFTYERPIRIGKGFYRLTVVVSGDHVSEITHSVKVPDSFTRKYAEMRSKNANLHNFSIIAILLLYVIGGCAIGLFILFNQHRIIWRTPCWWALLISTLTSVEYLNQLPFQWMAYNTALSQNSFLINYIISAFMQFGLWFVILFISFMAAESLTRVAFGNLPQLWTLWRPTVASSYGVLGKTIAGYLITPLLLAFTVLFYIFTTAQWHWWTPSSALFDPNILATYFPWWQSLAISLKAGFWEECLFRAIPLSCGALIGQRFGHRNTGIAVAFVIQILVFGAGHAMYPAQPAYARVVELVFVSSVFGGIYLKFGLLASIISHFCYDVFWFSLPIFVSSASSAWISKVIIVVATFIPLWIVIAARLRTKAWHEIPALLYNFAWQPPVITPRVIDTTAPIIKTVQPGVRNFLLIASTFGLLAWLITTPFKQDGVSLMVTRSQASTVAQADLNARSVDLNSWYPVQLPITDQTHVADNHQHRFIWQAGGKDVYHALLGTYLRAPFWVERLVKFTGTIPERAEEHREYVDHNGMVFRYYHILPETQPGKKLTQEEARLIALATVKKEFNRSVDQLIEISAVATKHPDRIDWLFTFAVPEDYPLSQGQARINVVIGGDQVVDSYRFIFVPEEYRRAQDSIDYVLALSKQIARMLLYLLLIVCTLATLRGTHVAINMRSFFCYFLFLALMLIGDLINSLPTIIGYFNTSQPFTDQLFRALSISIIIAMVRAALLALLIVFVNAWHPRFIFARNSTIICIGYGVGIITAGLLSLLNKLLPAADPIWATMTSLGSWSPILDGLTDGIISYVSLTLVILLFTTMLSALSSAHRSVVTISICFTLGFLLFSFGATTLSSLIIGGIVTGVLWIILYYTTIRYDHALVPLAVAGYLIPTHVQQAFFNAHPFALAIHISVILIILLISIRWYKTLAR